MNPLVIGVSFFMTERQPVNPQDVGPFQGPVIGVFRAGEECLHQLRALVLRLALKETF